MPPAGVSANREHRNDPGHSGSALPVAVLVVGTDEWAIAQSCETLTAAGHTVFRCHEPGSPAFPCNALRPGVGCPLDHGVQVVVSSRARPLRAPAPDEMGAICGLHAGVPLLLTGISTGAPFGPWTAGSVAPGGDLGDAVRGLIPAQRTAATDGRTAIELPTEQNA